MKISEESIPEELWGVITWYWDEKYMPVPSVVAAYTDKEEAIEEAARLGEDYYEVFPVRATRVGFSPVEPLQYPALRGVHVHEEADLF